MVRTDSTPSLFFLCGGHRPEKRAMEPPNRSSFLDVDLRLLSLPNSQGRSGIRPYPHWISVGFLPFRRASALFKFRTWRNVYRCTQTSEEKHRRRALTFYRENETFSFLLSMRRTAFPGVINLLCRPRSLLSGAKKRLLGWSDTICSCQTIFTYSVRHTTFASESMGGLRSGNDRSSGAILTKRGSFSDAVSITASAMHKNIIRSGPT